MITNLKREKTNQNNSCQTIQKIDPNTWDRTGWPCQCEGVDLSGAQQRGWGLECGFGRKSRPRLCKWSGNFNSKVHFHIIPPPVQNGAFTVPIKDPKRLFSATRLLHAMDFTPGHGQGWSFLSSTTWSGSQSPALFTITILLHLYMTTQAQPKNME